MKFSYHIILFRKDLDTKKIVNLYKFVLTSNIWYSVFGTSWSQGFNLK